VNILIKAIHERNQAEVVTVVNDINALNDRLRAAKKEERPDLVRRALRLLNTYSYLKWEIEKFPGAVE
jgi:hypothetical protein